MAKTKAYLFVCLALVFMLASCDSEEDCLEQLWFEDADSDGYGNPSSSQSSCDQPNGFVSDNTDFDDTNGSLNPKATEVADNDIDENGDGIYDYNLYPDGDNDGFGDKNAEKSKISVANVVETENDTPSDYSLNNLDCNDANASISPDAEESTDDEIDNDCDGLVDECEANADCEGVCIDQMCEPAVTWYRDSDGDTFGDETSTVVAGATAPAGYVSNSDDCDDSNADVNPDENEVHDDGLDNDCNPATPDVCAVMGESNCSDGIDNDCDGFIDCNDFDCCPPG